MSLRNTESPQFSMQTHKSKIRLINVPLSFRANASKCSLSFYGNILLPEQHNTHFAKT